jgi:hypothetical protein
MSFDGHDHVGGVLDEGQKSRLDVAEGVLGPLALGDQLATGVDPAAHFGTPTLEPLPHPHDRAVPTVEPKLMDRPVAAPSRRPLRQGAKGAPVGLGVFLVDLGGLREPLDEGLVVTGGPREAAGGPGAHVDAVLAALRQPPIARSELREHVQVLACPPQLRACTRELLALRLTNRGGLVGLVIPGYHRVGDSAGHVIPAEPHRENRTRRSPHGVYCVTTHGPSPRRR